MFVDLKLLIAYIYHFLYFSVNSYTLKSLKGNVENLFIEKQKMEKGDKAKKPGKGKGKAKLTVESNMVRKFSLIYNFLFVLCFNNSSILLFQSHITKYGFDTFDDNEYDDFM